MAILKLYQDKLQHNYEFLKRHFEAHNVDWGIVTKLLCGNRRFLQEVLNLGAHEIHDSRISNLRAVKEIDPRVQTVYIKPPPKRSLAELVRYADVSFNTEYETIRLLSEEAGRQGKVHWVILMVELGDLREGVMGDDLVDFYEKVFRLPNIKVIGLGANLNCLHGVMPNQDKLVQLCLYKQIIELKFGREIPWISGGTTVTLPLMLQGRLPKGINHFRVGEALFFGKNLFTGHTIEGMYDDVFELFAEVIDVTRKPAVPHGDFGENPYGDTAEVDESLYGQENVRAILDVGTLDISPQYLLPRNQRLEIGGASSDMLILDLGEQNKENLRVGDYIRFRLKYMGALHLLNSNYIGKEVTESDPEALASGAEAATEDVINELSMEEGVRE